MMSRRLSAFCLAAACVLLLAAGCSSGDSASKDTSTTTSSTAVVVTTQPPPPGVLQILVTNDDGVGSEGINAVTEALQALPNTKVVVVAPAEEQSGQGGKVTGGTLTASETTTIGGYPALGVDGFPADSVIYALDQDGIDFEPNLVVSGINKGQNIGAFIDLSGTVGAARAAVARGIPALAASSGTNDVYDFATAAAEVSNWVEEHRDGLLAGTYSGETILLENLNVPSCTVGTNRGIIEVPPASITDDAFQKQDCASTLTDPPDDIIAFNNGFITLSPLPLEPATTPTTVSP